MDRIGRYKIVKELGRGAMGVVYHAIDPNIGRPLAIKTIRLGEVRNSQERTKLTERLFREARSAGMLSHPGIVTVYDVEQDGDTAFIAMEFVDGPTLDDLLSRERPLSPSEMFSILAQTAAAVDYAHSKGIVHRDIKPANIMVTAAGAAKITDFGIAKVTASEQFTMTGTIVGTPHYMSPEQVQGKPVDGRSDQFSLAVIAYEMLTGEKPFTGEHLTTVVYKIVAEEPTSLRRLNPSIAQPIEDALMRALAKKPDLRYRTCAEFITALEAACSLNKGWKAMLRGGSLQSPTVASVASMPRPKGAPVLRSRTEILSPAAQPPQSSGLSSSVADEAQHGGFFRFLLAALVAAGLLALIGWQAAPWLTERAAAIRRAEHIPQPREAAPLPKPSPAAPVRAPQDQRPSPVSTPIAESKPPASPPVETHPAAAPPVETKPVETKPVDTKPVETRPAPAPPTRIEQRSRATVMVMTIPPGATITLDGRPDTVCTSPCSIPATPGRHAIRAEMAGHQAELRDVTVTGRSQELAPILMRAAGGTVFLSSDPQGATVLVNGEPWSKPTPAQLNLAPGTYHLVVEKEGRRGSRTVQVQNGSSDLIKIPLQ